MVFKDEKDYELFSGGDVIETVGVVGLEPGKDVIIKVKKQGTDKEFEVVTKHTMSKDQIEWFKMGSALNLLANRQ